MLGIILGGVALLLYGSKKYRYISIFLYISFMLGTGGGLGLWTDWILGAKNKDLALVYTFCINAYLISQHKFRLPSKDWWVKCYKILLLFLIGCVFFSYFYYKFTPFQILQGGRDFLLIFSVFILIRVSKPDLQRVLELLLGITIVTSILYILQIVVGRPLMPYNSDYSIDTTTGLVRLYNRPPMVRFFLLASFVCPRFFPGKIYLYRILFFVAIICSLGRTYIISTILGILLVVVMMGRGTKIVKTIVVLGLLFLPFVGMISERFEKGNTIEDVQNGMEGGYADFKSGDGTMSYRIAWLYERGEYLTHRPIGEQIFGMGLISGSQSVVYKMYHFRLGLRNEDGEIDQLSTPDSSYGNLLTKLGFLGGVIYLVFAVSLSILFFRYRKDVPILTICSVELIIMFITAFSGSGMSYPSSFVIYFLALSLLYPIGNEKILRNRNSKWLLIPIKQD